MFDALEHQLHKNTITWGKKVIVFNTLERPNDAVQILQPCVRACLHGQKRRIPPSLKIRRLSLCAHFPPANWNHRTTIFSVDATANGRQKNRLRRARSLHEQVRFCAVKE